MPVATDWKPEYTERALGFWEEYQRSHDLTSQIGQVAAIDPVTGRVWVGASGAELAVRVQGEGVDTPVYLVRVGYPSYVRKGRR